jgi:hypothetical protein
LRVFNIDADVIANPFLVCSTHRHRVSHFKEFSIVVSFPARAYREMQLIRRETDYVSHGIANLNVF